MVGCTSPRAWMRLRGIVTIPPFRLTGWAWTSLVRVIATRRLARSVEKENSSCMLTVLLYSILRIYLCFEGGVKIVKAPGLYARERKVEKKSGKKGEGREREGRGEPSVKGLGYLCMFAIQEQTHCDQTGCFVAVNHHHLDSFSPSPPFVQLRIYFGSTDAGVTPSNCDYPYNHL